MANWMALPQCKLMASAKCNPEMANFSEPNLANKIRPFRAGMANCFCTCIAKLHFDMIRQSDIVAVQL